MDHHHQFSIDSPGAEPLPALVGRLLWLVIGPVVLAVLTLLIVIRGTGWMTGEDWTYFAVMVCMIWGRWIEIRTGHGRTAFSRPANTAHLRRYVTMFVPWALLIWCAANVVGNHLIHML